MCQWISTNVWLFEVVNGLLCTCEIDWAAIVSVHKIRYLANMVITATYILMGGQTREHEMEMSA